MILRHVNYICDPRTMTVEISFPIDSRYVIILLKVDNKVAKSLAYAMSIYPTKREEYDPYIKRFCDNFMKLIYTNYR